MDLNWPPPIIRRYSYPGWQWANAWMCRPFEAVPAVHQLIDDVEQHFTMGLSGGREQEVHINHTIGTRYLSRNDYIGWHADRTLDIRRNTPILIFSFGEDREMHFRHRGSTDMSDVVLLDEASLFILGPKTNATTEHTIVPVRDEVMLERDPKDPVRIRYSLVMRDIHTVAHRSDMMRFKKDRLYRDADEVHPVADTGWNE